MIDRADMKTAFRTGRKETREIKDRKGNIMSRIKNDTNTRTRAEGTGKETQEVVRYLVDLYLVNLLSSRH